MTVYGPLTLDAAQFGRERILLDRIDVTYLRNVPTLITERSHATPWGWRSCTLYFPQMTGHEGLGLGPLSMIRKGVNVDIQRIKPDGKIDRANPLFEGFVTGVHPVKDERQYGVNVECVGYLYQADQEVRKPPPGYLDIDNTDLANLVPYMLTQVVGRRYKKITVAGGPTGVKSRKRGSLSQSVLNFASELITTSWTANGDRWTVLDKSAGRRAHMVKVDKTNHDYTISYGAQGVTVDVTDDLTERPNVIYGSGIRPDGGAWSNVFYPEYHPDDTPIFPLSPGSLFNPGSATTGFQDFSDRMRRSGFPDMASQDTYLASDVDDVEEFQRRGGITVDGIVGRQTWDRLFLPGSAATGLIRTRILPLAWDPRVEPHLFNGRGQVIGANPAYNPDILRVEKWNNYGEGVTKRDARLSARRELHVIDVPAWQGQIILRTNPIECHRKLIKAGRNIFVKHFGGGAGVLFHIADFTDNRDGSVTLSVDTAARDYMTLADIRARNKENRSDPARGILRRAHTRSRSAFDTPIQFDAESPAGRVPKHQVQGGLWSIIPILFGGWGTIVKTEYHSDPDAQFWLGAFAKRPTANQLASLVGDPGTSSDSKPWDTNFDALDDIGLLMAYGTKDSPCGYFPRDKTESPTPPLTGEWQDRMSWDWATSGRPVLWIAEFADRDTTLWGRFYNAPVNL